VEDESIHLHSAVVSGYPVGRQVHCSRTRISICPNTAGANEILPPAIALHCSRTG